MNITNFPCYEEVSDPFLYQVAESTKEKDPKEVAHVESNQI